MKKRILGLLLALCLVVGLLPMAALAEANPAKVNFNFNTTYGNLSGKREVTAGSTKYYKTIPSGASSQFLGLTTGSETDWSVKFEYPAEGAATLTLKDLNLKTGGIGLIFGDNAIKTPSAATCKVPLNIVLEGANTIDTTVSSSNNHLAGGLILATTGDVTISGTGSLNLIDNKSNATGGTINTFGNLILDNVDIAITLSEFTGTAHAISVIGGNVTIKGGSLSVNGWDNPATTHAEGMKTGYQRNAEAMLSAIYATKVSDKGGDLTIQDSAKVTLLGSPSNKKMIQTETFTIKDSDVEVAVVSKDNGGFFSAVAPTITYGGEYVITASTNAATYTDGTLTAPTKTVTYDAASVGSYKYFKISHEHHIVNDNNCTTDDKCIVCGTVMTAAKADHTPGTVTDCTKDTLCTNPGCTQVAIPAKAAHTPEADDGDCTTAIKCADCGTVTTPAETAHTGGTATCTKKAECAKCGKEYGELAKHTYTRPDCSVDSICTVCNQVAVKAGEHTGGTATCAKKAVCVDCGKEYGELGVCAGGTATCAKKAVCATCGKEYGELSTVHTPAADDGNCTTAIKCSVCGKETTAAKAAHAYTDNNDASCNNAGCTFTRTIETPKPGTNGSATTGDVSVFIAAGLALASAISFGGVSVLRKKKG